MPFSPYFVMSGVSAMVLYFLCLIYDSNIYNYHYYIWQLSVVFMCGFWMSFLFELCNYVGSQGILLGRLPGIPGCSLLYLMAYMCSLCLGSNVLSVWPTYFHTQFGHLIWKMLLRIFTICIAMVCVCSLYLIWMYFLVHFSG